MNYFIGGIFCGGLLCFSYLNYTVPVSNLNEAFNKCEGNGGLKEMEVKLGSWQTVTCGNGAIFEVKSND